MAFSNDRMDARDWSLLGLLSLLWSGSFIFNGLVLKELPPLTLVLLRIALAAAILLIPLTTILLGSLVLGETISLREILGALVIGSALLVIDGRIFNVLRLVPRPS